MFIVCYKTSEDFRTNTCNILFCFSFQLKNNAEQAKNGRKVVEGGVIGGGGSNGGIFQTEIGGTTAAGDGFDSSDDDDDIEQQMLNMSKQKLSSNQVVGVGQSSPLKTSVSKEVAPGSGSKQDVPTTAGKAITKPLSSMFLVFY